MVCVGAVVQKVDIALSTGYSDLKSNDTRDIKLARAESDFNSKNFNMGLSQNHP